MIRGGGLRLRGAALCLLGAVLLFTGQPALSEGLYLYDITFDESMTRDFYQTYCPFPETILFLNDQEDNQALVMLLDKGEYPSASEYLENAYQDMAGYGEVLSYSGILDYTLSPDWPAKMTQIIVEENGSGYKEYNVCADYDGYMLAVQISVALSPQHDDGWADEFFGTFVNEKFSLQKVAVDDRKTGIARGIRLREDGEWTISLELAELVPGGDEYDYFVQSTGNTVEYPFAPDARVYLPKADDFFANRRVDSMDEAAKRFRALSEAQPDFLLEFSTQGGKILWMDYCDLV